MPARHRREATYEVGNAGNDVVCKVTVRRDFGLCAGDAHVRLEGSGARQSQAGGGQSRASPPAAAVVSGGAPRRF